MDLITAAAVAYVSKDGIEKLLGPTFEYYGQGLKNLTESFNIKAKENLKKIFGRAIVKKGHELEKNGIINPRIIKEIVLDGAFCDTNIISEYYSGILASSRTEDGNDEGIHYINILKGLSSKQLKLHYAIYSKFFKEHKGEEYNLHSQTERNKLKVYFSIQEVFEIFKLKNIEDLNQLTSEAFPAIYHADLVESYKFDTSKQEKQFEFSITLLGTSLFLQALGYGEIFTPRCLGDARIEEIIKNIMPLNEI